MGFMNDGLSRRPWIPSRRSASATCSWVEPIAFRNWLMLSTAASLRGVRGLGPAPAVPNCLLKSVISATWFTPQGLAPTFKRPQDAPLDRRYGESDVLAVVCLFRGRLWRSHLADASNCSAYRSRLLWATV